MFGTELFDAGRSFRSFGAVSSGSNLGYVVSRDKVSASVVQLVWKCYMVDLCFDHHAEVGKSDAVSSHRNPAGSCFFGIHHISAQEGTNPHSGLGLGVVSAGSVFSGIIAGGQSYAAFFWRC